MLATGNAGALGTGPIALSGGELLTTTNARIAGMLAFSGPSTIAAAHGITLSENASSCVIGANANINIGSPGEDGTVLWHTNPGSFGSGSDGSVDVRAGTLKVADGSFSVIGSGSSTIVDAGATIDMAGFTADISNLLD